MDPYIVDNHRIQDSFKEQRQKQIQSVKRRFAAALKRVVFMLKFNVPDLKNKLSQEEVDLNQPEDAAFIKTLLIKEDRTQFENEYLKKAFRKMKFFLQQAQILQPETYNKLFESVRYVRKRENEILFTYGQRDHTYFIILKGSVTLLVPNANLLDKIKNNTISLKEMRLKTKELLIKYTEKVQKLQEKREWHEVHNNHPVHVIKKKNYLGQLIEETGGFEKYLHAIFPDFEIIKNMFTGDSFGEVAVINRSHRTGTVVCREECDFMTLDAYSFDQILKAQERQTLKVKNQFISKISETSNITETRRNDLIHSIRVVNFKLFDVIYKEGQVASDIFFIYNGEVELSRTYQENIIQDQTYKKPQHTEKHKIRISLCTASSIIGLEDMLGTQIRKLTATCNSRICTLYALPRIAFLSCVTEKEREVNQTNHDWRYNQIVNSLMLSQKFMEQKKQEKQKQLTPDQKDLYFAETAIQQQVSKNYQQVIKREQVIEKLQANSQRQGYQAFLKDFEIEQKHTNFGQKITAIRDGYYFSEDTERMKKLNMLLRIKKKVFQGVPKTPVNYESSEFINRSSRVNSQRIRHSSNALLITELPDQKRAEESGEVKSSKLHKTQISMGETDQDSKRLHSNCRSHRVMSTGKLSANDGWTNNEPKRKRVLYSTILRKSNEQKKRQYDQYSSQVTQETSQQLQPKLLINYKPVDNIDQKWKKSTSAYYLKKSLSKQQFRPVTVGDINNQIKSIRTFLS